PDYCRNPAPIYSDSRSHNGGSACYGGKMGAPQYKFVGWHIINTVVDFMCRGHKVGVKSVDLLRDEARVNKPSERESHETQKYNHNRGHKSAPPTGFLLSKRGRIIARSP